MILHMHDNYFRAKCLKYEIVEFKNFILLLKLIMNFNSAVADLILEVFTENSAVANLILEVFKIVLYISTCLHNWKKF